MYTAPALEDNRDMSAAGYTAVVEPLEAGALLRLVLDGAPPRVTWAWPERGVWAVGLGEAGEGVGPIAWESGAPEGMPGPFFGGFAFDETGGWPGWPQERWLLPRVLAFWANGRTWAAVFGRAGETGLRRWLGRLSEEEPVRWLPPARRVGGTSRAEWDERVGRALAEIRRGGLKKVVLARAIAVEADQPFEVRRALKGLEARFPSCRTFSFRAPGGEVFLGATPELLCEVRDGRVYTEALAGTAAAGQGEALLGSEKDRAEHAEVVAGVRAALAPRVTELELPDGPGLRQLANVVHLWTPIAGALPEGLEPLEVARLLHPTPATNGSPREAASEFLRTHEGLARGWYAGAIGHRGPSGLHLSVALRCALISGNRATLYVGAGIVEGSTPELEWAETERKALAMLGALGVEGEGAQPPPRRALHGLPRGRAAAESAPERTVDRLARVAVSARRGGAS